MANPDYEPTPEREDPGEFRTHIRQLLQQQIGGEGPRVAEASVMEGVSKPKLSLTERDLLAWVRRTNMRQVSTFTRQMAILLSIGMPLLKALRSVATRSSNQKLKHVIYRVGIMVENGDPFWHALSQFPQFFPSLYVSTVRAGELSGQLDSVLGQLADYTQEHWMMRRRVWAALTYPILVVVVAVATCAILSSFIVPVFTRMFREFGQDMPPISQAIASVVRWIPQNWHWVLLAIAGVFAVYSLLYKTFPVRLLSDRIKLRLPIFGAIVHKMIAARFARTFCLLFSSGVPITESLSVCRGTMNNEVAALKINSIREGVENGRSLGESMRGQRVFPDMLSDMVTVGEQAGRLDEVLPKIADIYEDEVDVTMKSIGSIIEPLLILFIGALVLFVFAGFFAPYIRLLRAASSTF